MADRTYTVVNNHIILFPGRPDQLDITEARQECEWCRKTYPQCGSDTPHAYCSIFDLSPEFIFVTQTDKGMAID